MMTPGFARASRRVVTGLTGLMVLLAGSLALSQTPAPAEPSKTVAPPGTMASTPAHVASTPRAGTSTPKAPGKAGPMWRELSPNQHQALAPLASTWNSLSEAQKRKWLALSANYPKMAAPEQEKLHSRMAEWVALSPQQRALARLNFGETQKISPDDKKAKWEAYQALPAEEKRKLAAGAAKPPTTAAAVRPVPSEKMASIPKPPKSDNKTPRIAVAPHQVDHNTLLPQQPPANGGPN